MPIAKAVLAFACAQEPGRSAASPRGCSMIEGPDLFAAAGIDLEPVPSKPKRPARPRKPTPAERAASGRLVGARRGRCPCALESRVRTVPVRDLAPRRVFPFPLSRNANILEAMAARLPHGYDDSLGKKASYEKTKLEKRLISTGLPRQSASECATELLHQAHLKRIWDAHKEAGIL